MKMTEMTILGYDIEVEYECENPSTRYVDILGIWLTGCKKECRELFEHKFDEITKIIIANELKERAES